MYILLKFKYYPDSNDILRFYTKIKLNNGPKMLILIYYPNVKTTCNKYYIVTYSSKQQRSWYEKTCINERTTIRPPERLYNLSLK